MHLGSLESTQEARVALGASITRYTHAKHEPVVNSANKTRTGEAWTSYFSNNVMNTKRTGVRMRQMLKARTVQCFSSLFQEHLITLWRRRGLVVSALDLLSGGRWFEPNLGRRVKLFPQTRSALVGNIWHC